MFTSAVYFVVAKFQHSPWISKNATFKLFILVAKQVFLSLHLPLVYDPRHTSVLKCPYFLHLVLCFVH